MTSNSARWGFIRETRAAAEKAGRDKDTGVCRTGIEDYLEVIFPETKDWIHDQATGWVDASGKKRRFRPDYRSDSLRTIIEIDGLPHYQKPSQIKADREATAFYESHGYRVVRIPYFIQLTNVAVKSLFGVEVSEPLFDPSIPSMGPLGANSPAYLCPRGLERMAEEFTRFPDQYEVNLAALKVAKEPELVEWELLEEAYERAKRRSGCSSPQ